MTITPLLDRVALRPREIEAKTVSGLFVPENVSEASALGALGRGHEGEVLAVGPDVKGDIRAGDVVAYRRAGGTALRADGGASVLVLAERDVMGILCRADGEVACHACGQARAHVAAT